MSELKNLSGIIIIISVTVYVLVFFLNNEEVIKSLSFLDYQFRGGYLYFETFQNTFNEKLELWRLVTPAFIHFSFMHIVFNCLWVYVLGKSIEQIHGMAIFLGLFIFTSILSNIAEYFFTGPSLFGGLSGFVYGMIGFVIVNELQLNKELYGLPPAFYLFAIIWLVLGFIGILGLFGLGSIANFAHLGGLIGGIIYATILNIVNLKT
jgi:GlpG protein